jgi:hypothetical protein
MRRSPSKGLGNVMKTKSFIVLLVCIVGTSFLLIAFGNQRPTIQNIVQETNKQLSKLNLKKVRSRFLLPSWVDSCSEIIVSC